MKNNNVTVFPESYKQAVKKELQGCLTEVSYQSGNYINSSRKLVTDHSIDAGEAGRETVPGGSITKQCCVYLPAGYNKEDISVGYNVLYLLHGVGGNRYEWLSSNGKIDNNYIICNIFDNLIANKEIEPMIVVFPEGRSAHDWMDTSFNSEGTNMLGFYYFDYEMRYDLIPFIESEYHTLADIKDSTPEGIASNRLHRAIAGLSMGGMQSLNLGLGGYRCDSTVYTGKDAGWKNGLDTTVLAPGMGDLFAYVGAFSNAPTSSDGKVLGSSVAACPNRLHLLYITCGDADGVAYEMGYTKAINELWETASDNIGDYFKVIIKDRGHDFSVWNNGAFNFARLAFHNEEEHSKLYEISMSV